MLPCLPDIVGRDRRTFGNVRAGDEHHRKHIANSEGTDAVASIQRALCYVTLLAEDERGSPVEVTEFLSGKGHLGDLDWSLEALQPRLEELYRHLQAKRTAVPARGGLAQVVMGPQLAGILAHEAMGHPCEADLVLGGAVTGDLVGKPVAAEQKPSIGCNIKWKPGNEPARA